VKRVLRADPRVKAGRRDLVDMPVVIRVTSFTERAVEAFARKVSLAHTIGQPVIPVVVDSYGGDAYALLAMAQEVRNSRIPVATVCEAKAMSAGAVLFSFGADGMRYMAPDARLMLHSVSGGVLGRAADVKADAEETERLNTRVFAMLDENTGHPPGYFLDALHRRQNTEWYIDSRTARKLKLCNHIRVPTLTVSVSVNVSLD
jgi:ATP-dependent Clp protease protease subunit